MLDPIDPSPAPPSSDEAIKPLSLVAALGWVAAIHLGFLWLALLLGSLREAMRYDFVALISCQLVAYGLGLFFLLRRYAPSSAIRDFVGARSSHWGLYGLACVVGASATVPISTLLGRIEQRWPIDEGPYTLARLFVEAGPERQALIALGVVVLAPLLEEAVFRGAVFVPLRKRYPTTTVVLVTAALFALVHQVPQRLLPLFLMGIVVGYLRAASGSLATSVLAHVAFNAVPMAQIYLLGAEAEEMDVPAEQLFAATALCAAALVAFAMLAQRSRRAAEARAGDR